MNKLYATAIISVCALSGCAMLPKKEDTNTIIRVERENDLTVRDMVISVMLSAPIPNIGATKNSVRESLAIQSGHVIFEDGESMIAYFKTAGTSLSGAFDSCELQYFFANSVFKRGPVVIGQCLSVEITGSKSK